MSPMLIIDADTQEFRALNPLCVKEIRGARDNTGRQAIIMTDDMLIMWVGKREDLVTLWRSALK